MSYKRRVFTREFKLSICQEIESGLKTQAQISREHRLGTNLISRWLKEYRHDPVNCFFGNRRYPLDVQASRIKELEAALGRATLENQLLKKANSYLKKLSTEKRFTK